MDKKELRSKELIGRKVWVEATLLTTSQDNVFGNVTVALVTPTTEKSVLSKVFIHSSSVVKVLQEELKVGDRVQWTPDNAGQLVAGGELLWMNADYALVQWDNFPEPEIAGRDQIERESKDALR